MFNYGNGCGSYMPSVPVVTTMGGNGSNGWGDGGIWALIIIFAIFGWGGGGFGNGWGNGGSQGALTRSDLCSEMNSQGIENGVRGVQQGLCDGFYAVNSSFGNLNNTLATNFAQIQNSMNQGFSGINTGLVSQGYESRLATQAIGAQLAQCCCDTNQLIQANTTQGVMNTGAIQQQIQNCCCENEKISMQSRFDAAQEHCATLQAIDKVGDRIIDYLNADKAQALRDENQALRLAASQQAQNNYLVNQLRPCPVPAYVTCNPWASQQQYGCCASFSGCCGSN